MRVAFDAKRVFNNGTGLGNYARVLLNALMRDYKDNEYLLFTPRLKDEFFHQLNGSFKTILPETKYSRAFSSVWRSWGISRDLLRERVNIYHGLSNELPFNIHHTGIKTVVTIHDLIFFKHTEQYPWIDRQVYKTKTKYAVKHADKIIAISHETKHDIIAFYKVPAEKIEVIYPAVEPIFYSGIITPNPAPGKKYLLNVSSFYPRKNQRNLVLAYAAIANKIEEELWLVGGEGNMKAEIEALIESKKLTRRIKVLTGVSNAALPALYQNASAFIYPSVFEGFGMPVQEALFCGTPVIASKGGAIEEAAGGGSVFIDPYSVEDIAGKILKVTSDAALRKGMIEAGRKHAETMNDKALAANTMRVYRGLM
ncbi:MAG TPA: glycosyltransferase family 1 protein [Chitinophagales bacterium]|nr:glycosyltransferase family 1 protein [Chitinophagales bacterium]